MIPRGLSGRMVAASVLLVAVVAVVFTVLLGAIGDLRGSTRWTEHSVFVLGAAGELQNDLGDFGSATRNYVDDPTPPGLRTWRAMRASLPGNAAALRRVVRDNPTQAAGANGIATDIDAYITQWATPLVTMAQDPAQLKHAQALSQLPAGRNMAAAIRTEFERFGAREKALGLERGGNSRHHAATASVAAIVALVALVLAIAAFTLAVARSVARPVRRMAGAAARLGRGELGVRVEESGRGEVRDLAEAFNRMGASLRDSRDELETQNRELESQQSELEDALEQLGEEKAQVEGFQRFIELVSRENDPDRLADTVLRELCDYTDGVVGTLYGVDGDHGAALNCLSALGVDHAQLPEEILPGEGLAGRAIVERKIVTATFGEGGLRFESFGQPVNLGQELHVPLVHGEQSVGVVTIGRSAGRPLVPVELERIRYLAAQAAVGLSHAFALRRARNQAALNRAVLDTAYDAFVSFDERGLVTAWNPQAEAIFGWKAMEAVGQEISRLVVPAERRGWYRDQLARFLRGQESELLNRRVEVTGRHRDGRDFPAEVAITPIELDGEWRFNAFIHDISDRRLLEQRSGKLFSISLDFMCTFTREGQFVQINPAWRQVLGWSDEQLLGSRMIDYVHPDDRERTLQHADKLEQGGDGSADFENRWRTADGSYRWLLWSAHLSRDEGLIYAVAKDVTEAKRSERFFQARLALSEALARADTLEQDLAGVLAAAGESLGWDFGAAWLPDEEGRVLRCERTWGAPGHSDPVMASGAMGAELRRGDGVVGRAWSDAKACWMSDVSQIVDDPSHPYVHLLHAAGVRAVVAVPLIGADGVVAVLQLLSREPREPDEDALRLLEAIGEQVGHALYRRLARMEADRMKDEFLALVSHELRTPLTSIVGYLELLDEDGDEVSTEQGRRFLEVIGRNAIRLQRLVDDVLFAARAEAGRLSLAEREVNLSAVAGESVAAARPRADESEVELALDADETPEVAGDPDRLGQAIDNLISNALKFTPPGGRVDVTLRNLGDRARIEVRDTGLGMSEEDLGRVFDRFFRSAATRDHVPGVGLGLTIVKTIVEGHGGTIEVSSTEGVGTTFGIELPLVPARETLSSTTRPE
ncbi:MAG TPA: PAS domain S-box protein [Thermoleophilaceae bacterium]